MLPSGPVGGDSKLLSGSMNQGAGLQTELASGAVGWPSRDGMENLYPDFPIISCAGFDTCEEDQAKRKRSGNLGSADNGILLAILLACGLNSYEYRI